MREGLLESLRLVVTGAMFALLGIIAALCSYYILRANAFRPMSLRWPRREKSPEEERADDKRRKKIQTWFWGGR